MISLFFRIVTPRAIILGIVLTIMWSLFTVGPGPATTITSSTSAPAAVNTYILCADDDQMLWWTGRTKLDKETGATLFLHKCSRGHYWWLSAERMDYPPALTSEIAQA